METTLRIAPAPRVSWLLVVFALVVGVVAAIALAGNQRRVPPPFGPAANGVILSTGGDADILVSEADGSGTRPLISGPTVDMGPWFAHDGTRLMFWRQPSAAEPTELLPMLANADGSDIRPLVDAPLQDPYWNEFDPGDDRLAVVSSVDSRRALSIIDIASGELRTLAVPGLNVDNSVFWSPPNGDELIFTARPVADSATGAGLYAIKPDGSGFREIRPPRAREWAYQDLDIAPDGSQLSYWILEVDDAPNRITAHIHVVDLATGADRQVVFDRANEHEAGLRFSPDGTNGAIVTADAEGVHSVQLVDLAGSKPPRRVGPTFAGDDIKGFGFSPDGKQVMILLDGAAPTFVDVASGAVTTGPVNWNPPYTWQRLAP